MEQPRSIDDLHDKNIVDILTRLPLKMVMACKCVSKRWRDILSEPLFARVHLNRSTSTNIMTFVNVPIPGGNKKAYLFDLEDPRPDRHFRKTTFRDSRFNGSVIFGSCNGLLLYGHRYEPVFYVCNPILRQHIRLPYTWPKMEDRNFCGLYGIGYCPSTEKYKVIKVTKCLMNDKIEVKICELGDWMWWRTIESVPPGNHWWNRGATSIDGSLYWFVTRSSNSIVHDGAICCFNLKTETFHELPPPPPLKHFHVKDVSLWKTTTGKWCLHCSYIRFCMWGGCFSVCYFDGNRMNLWMKRRYKLGEESWIRALAIDTSSEICPLGKLSNGNMLTVSINQGDLATYNFVKREMVKEERTSEDCFVEIVHKPSFISPESL